MEGHKYSITPNGLVQGGDGQYSFDPITGALNYSGEVKVGVWIAAKTESVSGSFILPPALLKSSRITQPGQIISDGDLKIEITALFHGGAAVAFSQLSNPALVGSGILDLSGEYIAPKSFTFHDVVAGVHLTIVLEEVA